MRTVLDRIRRRILRRKGWVFTPKDFLDVGSRASVDQSLAQLTKQGVIRRLDRGIYSVPQHHPLVGDVSPGIDSLANAVAVRTGDKLFPSGAVAANYLGLSTQVPARPVYMTNGATRKRKVAGHTIVFKHARTPILDGVSDRVNLTLQALAYLGKNNIDDDVIRRCARQLDARDLRSLTGAKPAVAGWMADTIARIADQQYG